MYFLLTVLQVPLQRQEYLPEFHISQVYILSQTKQKRTNKNKNSTLDQELHVHAFDTGEEEAGVSLKFKVNLLYTGRSRLARDT